MHEKEEFTIEEVWGRYHSMARIITPRLMRAKIWINIAILLTMTTWRIGTAQSKKMIEAYELLSKYHSDFSSKENNITELGLDLFRKIAKICMTFKHDLFT